MGSATQKVGGPLLDVLPDGATVGGSWTFTGPLRVTDTTASSSTTTGCATFAGGVGIDKELYVAGKVIATGTEHRYGDPAGATDYAIVAAAGSNRDLFFFSGAGSARWGLRTGGAETGSDAGSPWAFAAYTDAGAEIDRPWVTIRAAAGLMTFGGMTRRSVATTGGRVKALDVVTDTTTLNATHNVVVCNKGTAMTINLPAVSGNAGRTYVIKNKGAGVVTIDGSGAQQIDNAATLALNQWQTATIVCDGAIWCVV